VGLSTILVLRKCCSAKDQLQSEAASGEVAGNGVLLLGLLRGISSLQQHLALHVMIFCQITFTLQARYNYAAIM